jgi:hypothetical protein
MSATKSREIIHKNMDAMSVTYDALDSLIDVKKNVTICIDRMVKIINKGKGCNRELEVDTRHAA